MAFGSLALIIVIYTTLSMVEVPIYSIIKIIKSPYAVEASQTIMVGFADMFLPSVIAQISKVR